MRSVVVEGLEVVVGGRLPRIARLRAEYYERVVAPAQFLPGLKGAGVRADLFTFLQAVNDRTPCHDYPLEWDQIAVLPLTTYDHWWMKQINDKTRNMVRRAQKKGVEIRVVPFTDELVKAIMVIYNESPLRQGKPFKHYGKDFETLKRDHASFADRSEFIGAFVQEELIGFIKLVHGQGVSNLMQIIAKIAERDRAPTNALIAKAVELCVARGVPYLHYGEWSTEGLGDFKKHHGFEPMQVPRYFVPLTPGGRLMLALRLHHKLTRRLPERWREKLKNVRAKWNAHVYGSRRNVKGAVAQPAEQHGKP